MADSTAAIGRVECNVPPPGWYCTRMAGHSGPCAAWPCAQCDTEGVIPICPMHRTLNEDCESCDRIPCPACAHSGSGDET